VKDQRPKNLNLFTIHQPIPAIASILHRISGVILFLAIPLILWGFHLSLASESDFDHLKTLFLTPFSKFIIWCCLSAFIYHFFAGIRHLLMDIHVGDDLKSGRLGAVLAILLSILFIVMAGFWLW